MNIYYHFTPGKNVKKILSEGIKPASKTGNKNQYDDSFQVDHDHSYFYSSEAISWVILEPIIVGKADLLGHNYVLIRAEIDDCVLERDYDQLRRLFYDKERITNKRGGIFGDEIEELRARAQGFGINNFQGITMENLKQTADSIPEIIWRHWPGAYRTKNTVSAVRFLDLDKEVLADTVCRLLLILTGRTPSLSVLYYLAHDTQKRNYLVEMVAKKMMEA